MKRILLMVAVAIMTAMNAIAQRVEVTDANGQGIPLVSVLTDEGNLIGTTDLNGIIADVKGAAKIALTHVAYKPQLVTVATLPTAGEGGYRVTMEDLDYGLDEIVVKPKPYIYVEAYYRVYVYRNDSLHYFFTGINEEYWEDFAEMLGIEYVKINKQTNIADFKQTLRNNEVYFMLNKALK